MKTAALLVSALTATLLPAQEPAVRNPWKTAPPVVPEAVATARVTAQTVLKGGGTAGSDLIIQRIEPPVFPEQPRPPSPLPAAAKLTRELWAARRAAEPNELLLFSPTVIVHPGGLSIVRWGTADKRAGYRQYAAWVRLDLSSIYACGDLTVGRRRYCLMPVMFHATDRMVQQWKAPAATDFKLPTDIILTEGDPDNAAALEPLLALLNEYDTQGQQIAHTAEAIKIDQAARAAWEAAHPAPPENAVIRFWTTGD